MLSPTPSHRPRLGPRLWTISFTFYFFLFFLYTHTASTVRVHSCISTGRSCAILMYTPNYGSKDRGMANYMENGTVLRTTLLLATRTRLHYKVQYSTVLKKVKSLKINRHAVDRDRRPTGMACPMVLGWPWLWVTICRTRPLNLRLKSLIFLFLSLKSRQSTQLKARARLKSRLKHRL